MPARAASGLGRHIAGDLENLLAGHGARPRAARTPPGGRPRL
jgi:hypothetical protein